MKKHEREDDDGAAEAVDEAATKKQKTEEEEEDADGDGEDADEKEDAKDDDDEEEDDDDDDDDDDDESAVRFAVICSSNNNRSMEAHKIFKEAGLDVESFGVGNKVRLPSPSGRSLDFDFDQTYQEMKAEIIRRGELEWYRDKGLLALLDRNISIKENPQRWQDYEDVSEFKIVFCFEERVFDEVAKDIKSREKSEYKEMHVLNLDVRDDPKEAVTGAKIALELCQACVPKATELGEALPEILKSIEDKYSRPIKHMTEYL